jgi:hypothetical protein
MNNSWLTLEEKMKIDEELAEMKKHPIDYSDIPSPKPDRTVRLANKAFLDTLPPDMVRELARRRREDLKKAGYPIPEPVPAPVH